MGTGPLGPFGERAPGLQHLKQFAAFLLFSSKKGKRRSRLAAVFSIFLARQFLQDFIQLAQS